MSVRIKRGKPANSRRRINVVKEEEVVPVIIQEDANTFAAYTIQSFADEDIGEDDNITEHITHHQQEPEQVNVSIVNHILPNNDEDDENNELQIVEQQEEIEQNVHSQQIIHVEDVSTSASNSSSHESAAFIVTDISRSRTFYCPNCGNCYSAAGSLKLHIRACMRSKDEQNEPDTSRKCDICNKVFNSTSYLREHMLRHTGKGPRKCPKCYRKFIDDDKYEAHMETHKLQEKLGMTEAETSSPGPGVAPKKIVKEYVCSFCSKKFTVVFDSRQTKRRYACDECREKYSNEEMLKQHKATLEEKREFHCDKCGRKFIFEGFLQRHLPHCDGTIKRRRDRN